MDFSFLSHIFSWALTIGIMFSTAYLIIIYRDKLMRGINTYNVEIMWWLIWGTLLTISFLHYSFLCVFSQIILSLLIGFLIVLPVMNYRLKRRINSEQ